MSYLVLARKWRPQNFDEVVGQPHVARILRNAVLSGRIAHAYLFTGARGVGKTSVARILARSLNCVRELSASPCGECSNCREIAQGASPDVLEIDGASNRGIDDIRELRETIRYRPSKSRYKIYIIDEVHMLTKEAFNALLKTLEEPPEHALFIFATTEPHKIPATILSRCQRFDFRRISLSLMVEHLRKIARNESMEVSEPVLYAIGREADGSMRDAQSLLEQLLAFSGDGLGDDEILDILGMVDRRSVLTAGEAIMEGNVRGCLETVDALYRRGVDTRRFCRHLCDHFRNLLFLALGEGGGHPEVSSEEAVQLKAYARKVSAESLFIYFQLLMKGEEDIRRSSLPKITLEMLLLRMARIPQLESLQSLVGKLDSLETLLKEGEFSTGALASPEARFAVTKTSVASSRELAEGVDQSPGVSMEEVSGKSMGMSRTLSPVVPTEAMESYVGEGGNIDPAEPFPLKTMVGKWPEFLRFLSARDQVMGAKLRNSTISMDEEGMGTLHVMEIFEDALKSEDSLSKLRKAVDEYFKVQCQWTVKSGAEVPRNPQERGEGGSSSSRSGSRRVVMRHPAVLQALEILGGELVDIRQPGSGRTGNAGTS